MTFAALPMYDLPEVRAATDALWAGIAGHLRAEGVKDVPTALERTRHHEAQWRDDALLFGQSCGYPLTHAFADELRVVATPRHAVNGCESGCYHSVIVVHEDAPFVDLAELRGHVAAINDEASHSGMNAFGALLAPLLDEPPFFRHVLVSGSHAASIDLVANGRAAVASIDCVTHALLARWRPSALTGTRILTKTASAPALPYVTRRSTSDDTLARLRAGLERAMNDAALAEVRGDLLLLGTTVLPDDAYDAIRKLEATHRLERWAAK